MEIKKLNDLDVWRHNAMIGVDPLWRYRAAKRGRISPKSPVYTDDEGKDIINLSINRSGHKRGDKTYPPFKKKVFLRTDVDDTGAHLPFMGTPKTLEGQPTKGIDRTPEGEALLKTKKGMAFQDRSEEFYTGDTSPEAEAYKKRWLDQFNRYRQSGLYNSLTGKKQRKYELYLKKLGLA